MPDPFVLAAILLLLPMVALLRFVGCAAVLSLDDVTFTAQDTVTVSSLESGDLAPLGGRTFKAIASWDANARIDRWEVQSALPIKGGITPEGRYTAPEAITGPSNEQIVAHAKHGTVDVTGNLTLRIDVDPTLTVDPPDITLRPGDAQQFSAKANWDPNSRLVSFDWAVNPGTPASRAITGGNYQAPATVPGSGFETVRATATYGAGTVSGQATVRIVVPPPSAELVALDTTTKGNWRNVLGNQGYALAHTPTNLIKLPPYLPALNIAGLAAPFTFVASPPGTTDPRGLLEPPPSTSTLRFAEVWHDANVLTLEFAFADFVPHIVAIYFVDWLAQARAQDVTILDNSRVPAVPLFNRNLSAFDGGQYLILKLSGKVLLRVTKTATPDAVISGFFFD